MKRLKQLLVISLVAIFAFAFAACGGSKTKTLSSISLDYSAAKTEYTVGDSFTSNGLVVTASYSDNSTAVIDAGDYTVDSSAYSTTTAGTYVITVSYTESEVTKTASYSVTVSVVSGLASISLDTSKVTTEFYINQDFDSTGLIVYAVIDGVTTDVSSSSSVIIDRSAYVSSEAGTYKINVFYTYGSTTKSSSYTVTVTDSVPGAGLNILVGGVVTTVTSVEVTGTSVTLSTDLISGVNLHEISTSGSEDTALTADQYTVTFYNESDVDTPLTGEALTVSNGTYILEVVYKDYVDPVYGTTYDLSSFLIIVVDNPVTAIELDTSNSTAVYTQKVGADSISSTWTYIITYKSGGTATVTADDVTVTLDTKTVGENKTASVSYTDGETVTCEVTYTITSASGTTNYDYSYEAISAAMAEAIAADEDGDKVALSASYFTGDNSFISYVGSSSSDVWRSNGSIEIKGEALQVTFYGTGTITIQFSSNKDGNTSSLALLDSDGNYITGTTTDATVATNDKGTYYTESTNTTVTVTFEITEAGTYTIATNVGGEGRVARIYGISMTDTVAPTGNTSTYSYEAISAAMAEAIAADEDGDKVALSASYFTGDNSFISYVGSSSSDVWRSNGSIEIKGEALQVTFYGTGTITIQFSSNKDGNTSSFALLDSDGNYITGTTTDATVATNDKGTYYTESTNTTVTVTFEITEAGTYTIATNVGGEGRVARIYGISMTDIY